MRDRRIATVVVLALWILLGPVGMALSGCAMMDGCDVLCSLSATAPVTAMGLASLPATPGLAPAALPFVPQNVWTVLDSPPRLAPALL